MSNIIQTTVTLFPPGPDGTQDIAPSDEPCSVLQFYSSNAAHDVAKLQLLAASYGFRVEVVTAEHEVMLGDPLQIIAATLDASMRRTLGIIDGAKPDPDDARMNELERAVRNQQRQLGEIQGALAKLTELLTAAPPVAQPMQPSPQQQANLFTTAQPMQLSPAQMAAQQKGYPLVGTPLEVSGDPTLPMNTRSRGAGRTPEMAAPTMAIAGPMASSSIVHVEQDANGKPKLVTSELPKVGTTLLAPLSDIKVPSH